MYFISTSNEFIAKRTLFVISILIALHGCESDKITTSEIPSSSDSTSTSTIGQLAGLEIQGPNVRTGSPGENLRLLVLGVDKEGRPIYDSLSVSWEAQYQSKATVDQKGMVTVGEELGNSWIYARSDEFIDSIAVWVQKPASIPSSFKISLVFSEIVPDSFKTALKAAANRWEEIIRAPLPAVSLDTLRDACGYIDNHEPPSIVFEGEERGVRIYVDMYDTFGENTYVEAVGGSCMNRGLPLPTTAYGVIRGNVNRFLEGFSYQRMKYLVHHEMGHALGLVGHIQFYTPKWLSREKSIYRGHLGLHGYYLETRKEIQELFYRPSNHWSDQDVMGGDPNLINRVSIGALMDMGYPAAWYGAGQLNSFEY